MPEGITPLSRLKKGQFGLIDSFTDETIKLKLLEMGCLPGEKVVVLRFAPMGDPMAVTVADSVLSIRIDEAESVLVKMDAL